MATSARRGNDSGYRPNLEPRRHESDSAPMPERKHTKDLSLAENPDRVAANEGSESRVDGNLPPVANGNLPPVANDVLPEETINDDIDFSGTVKQQRGWRLERKRDDMWRWRWQLKTELGKPITYKTKSGNTGYKRGSKYVRKSKLNDAKQKAANNV